MRFGAGGLSAGLAALLLTAGCKEGKPINEQGTAAPSAEQAQQTQQAQQPVAQSRAGAPEAQRQQNELAQQNPPAAQQPQEAAQAPASSSQAQGEQVVVGEVLTANDQEVLVSSQGEPQVRLQLKPETVITVDGRQARGVDIEEGSQVRASFNTQSGEPAATRIEVTSQRASAPTEPESGTSPPGSHEPGDQEAPFQPD